MLNSNYDFINYYNIMHASFIAWQTSYDFSEEIDGSADFYTISYTDSISGTLCTSVKVPAASCLHGICTHVLKRTYLSINCSSSSKIAITVFGTNRLGRGPPLNSTITGIIL